MADEEKEKLYSSLKDDDNENYSSRTSEIPMDDIPSKVKTVVKSELSKLLTGDQNNSASSSEILMDDIQAKMKMTTAFRSELSKLLNGYLNSSSSIQIPLLDPNIPGPLNLRLSDEAKREIIWKLNDRVNANEKTMLEMDDIPAKVKMADRLPIKTESQLLGEPHNDSSSDNESGNISDD